MTVSPSIEVNSVTLQTGHIRITLGPAEDDPPFRLENLVLFGNGGAINGKTNPATIPFFGAKLTANITFFNQMPIEFSISMASQGRKIGHTSRISYSAVGTNSIDVEVPIHYSATPWGTRGNIDWTVHIFFGSHTAEISMVLPIQLYAVAEDMTPMYKKQGIPKEMLNLFADPFENKLSSTANEWIRWVVTRCHASTEDRDIDEFLRRDAIHSYTYNTYSGAPGFSEGTKFDLLGWLKHRKTKSPLVTVNCLDQCSLAICALSLGLPYYLRYRDGHIVTRNDKQITTLQCFYKGTNEAIVSRRFGFINTIDLVGWGRCNSPFFSGNKANIIIRAHDSTSGITRESFKNHYFVCYNSVDGDNMLERSALDACAGPAINPQISLESYLDNVIDKAASRSHNGSSWRIYGDVEILDPTDTMNMLTLFTPSFYRRWAGGSFWNVLIKAQGSRPVPKFPIGASFTNLSNALEAINVQSSEFDVDIGLERSSITVEFSNQHLAPFATATIDVIPDFESALLQAESHQFHMQRDWHTVFAIPTVDEHLGDVNLVTQGDLNVALIIYGNVVIYLEGNNGPRTQFNALVQAINTYMVKAKTAAFHRLDSEDFWHTMPTSVPVGNEFHFKIGGPEIAQLAIASEKDIVQIIKGPYLTPEGDYSVTCTSYEAGLDRVAIGFAQAGTYYPHMASMHSIQITPPAST